MEDRKKLIIAIVAVVAIIAIVVGATFAYWTWTSDTESRTNVDFTLTGSTTEAPDTTGPDGVPDGVPDTYAILEGNGIATAHSLVPTSCVSTNHAIRKTVTIKYRNQTTNAVTITANLSVTEFTFKSAYKPTSGAGGTLNYIKYALTTSSVDCTTGVEKSGTFSGLTIPASGTTVTAVPYQLFSLTIPVAANTQTEQTATYYLYIWLDGSYSHNNVGDTNDDPMQGISFTTSWSGTIG